MPSTYAHFKYGQEIRPKLPASVRECIDACPELFQIGLHGPDILFYYKPLSSNPIKKQGNDLHALPGSAFFSHAKTVLAAHPDSKAHFSYVYGVLCHFALDVTCHGYIQEKIDASGISHGEIEVEFDRELLVRDGFDPVRKRLTDHIIASDENAAVIKDFYKNVTTKQIKDALSGMNFYNDILLAPSRLKRNLIYFFLRVSGHYESMHGLIVNYEKNPRCDDSTERLIELYGEAMKLGVTLLETYGDYLCGKTELPEIYRYNFSSELFVDKGETYEF